MKMRWLSKVPLLPLSMLDITVADKHYSGFLLVGVSPATEEDDGYKRCTTGREADAGSGRSETSELHTAR
jgi:hypothetical protein